MGVHGLWRLIDPSGRPVPLEALENKVLAVDVSIWLHQAVKGFQDSRGAPLPNAHLLGIYHRVCKLLYFRIRPVFVFDGGVPVLKKQTIINRNQRKSRMVSDANSIQNKLLDTLLKHVTIKNVLGEKIKPAKPHRAEKEDMFKLPAVEGSENELESTLDSSCDSSETDELSSSPTKQWDLHTIDEKGSHFKSLPADVRHEILTDLKETRKQSSWGRLHELPKESGDFSVFQMNRLLKRYSIQVSLEEAEKEMGGHSLSIGELETLLTEEGIVTAAKCTGRRIASDDSTRFLYIRDVKKAIEIARQEEEAKQKMLEKTEENEYGKEKTETSTGDTTDKEFQDDLAAAIQLSLQDVPSTSKDPISSQNTTFLNNFKDGDFESSSDSEEEKPFSTMAQAKSYMTEYSGLTPNEILKIISSSAKPKKKTTKQTNITEITNEDNSKIIQDSTIQSGTLRDVDLNKPDEIIETVGNAKLFTTKETHADIALDSSDSDDFIQVSEIKSTKTDAKKPVEIINDSSSDSDFIEVQNKSDAKLEIVIDPKTEIKDDIFSDIFSENANVKVPELPSARVQEEQKSTEKPTAEDTVRETDEKLTKLPLKNKQIDALHETKVELINRVKELPRPVPSLTMEQLNDMKSQLAKEQQELMVERNTKERMAGNITDQMYQEAQELLELFGMPYVVAPMEAEAQCAFLDDINLTDGTITDDSDIWLFGGKTVYKNFFNQNKHVMEFRSERIEHYFKLSREQMILLAFLVGSDYTLGIQGIGPVTALEILASFPPKYESLSLSRDEILTGLIDFRNWLTESRTIGRTALRSKLQNVTISDGFPNVQVLNAYMQPEVETCKDSFSWGKPDIVGLIDFAKEKFGWTQLKSEEILKPVIKRLEETSIQKSIKDYFKIKHKVEVGVDESKISKRVRIAIDRIAKKNVEEENVPKKKTRWREPIKSDEIPKPKMQRKPRDMHVKEIIPQKEMDKAYALKTKMKAIEIFRKSKQGPGFVKKRSKVNQELKEEAELSESSNSD